MFQNEWVRQNCAVQMERVRENYNWQVQNLREIRHYGTNQVTAVRDQYFEQVTSRSLSYDIQGQISFHFRWLESETIQPITCNDCTRITYSKDKG